MQSQSWMIVVVICATLIQLCRAVESSHKADSIVNLPGQPNGSFKQYAGYITIDEKQQRALFYYFVEAETEPASKPLVLYLEGGPGCSGIGVGAFSEHGPFRPSGGGHLVANDYSWNKEANMLYPEFPAGVGFSYSANKSFYDSVNDTITAQDNLKFLQRWFVQFPEYKNRDFFITGQSYAGHYVPQLAQLIVQSGLEFKLKGIAVGNPLLEFNTDFNARGEFYWSHGLISDSTYELVNSVCNTSQIVRENITGSTSAACSHVNSKISEEFPAAVDEFDVTADVCVSYGSASGQSPIMESGNHPLGPLKKARNKPKGAYEKSNVDPCVLPKTFEYLNRKDVQQALHAQLGNWDFCSGVLNYDMLNLEIPIIPMVGSLVVSGIRVLIYSGDQDANIPFTGTRSLINGLAKQLRLNVTVPYRGWYHDKQVGGWTAVYGETLTYATIRGGSHLAPLSSPERSLALFAAFLSGKPLSTIP